MGNLRDWDFVSRPVAAKEFLARRVMPTILNFQPEQFAILQNPEDLRLWEKNLVDRVGLTGAAGKAIAEDIIANASSCTESGCPSNDCDVD